MSTLQSFIEETKSKRLIVTSNNGKFRMNLSLLTAIILALILPQLTVIIAICALAGWVRVEVPPIDITVSE